MCKIKTLKDWVKEFRLAIRQGEWLEFDTSDYLSLVLLNAETCFFQAVNIGKF